MTDPDAPAPPPKIRLDGYGPVQLRKHMGINMDQFERARAQGQIPPGDMTGRHGGRWTQEQADALKARAQDIVQVLKPHPVGAAKTAAALAARTGLDVQGYDVQRLSEMGELAVADWFTKGRRSYALYDLDDLAVIGDEVIAAVVTDRQEWIARSVPEPEVLTRLGWTREELLAVAAPRGLRPGRFTRWDVEDVDALTSDHELDEHVRGDRRVTSDQGATILEIRLTDFRHMVDAGWIPGAGHRPKQISARETVDVPVYRVADIEAMRDHRFVDWDALSYVDAGQKSPLLEGAWARRQILRGREVRRLVDDLATRHRIPVTARLDMTGHHFWTLSWPSHVGARRVPTPTAWEVSMVIANDPRLEPHADDILLTPYDPDAPTTTEQSATGPVEGDPHQENA